MNADKIAQAINQARYEKSCSFEEAAVQVVGFSSEEVADGLATALAWDKAYGEANEAEIASQKAYWEYKDVQAASIEAEEADFIDYEFT